MSATSPRRFRRISRGLVEALESRIHLAGQPPVAMPDTFTGQYNTPLSVEGSGGAFSSFHFDAVPYFGGDTGSASTGSFSATRSSDGGVTIAYVGDGTAGNSSRSWTFSFSTPGNNPPGPGSYSASSGNLRITPDPSDTQYRPGQFTVLDAVYRPDGSIGQFAATFDQPQSSGYAAFVGAITYRDAGLASVLSNDSPADVALSAQLVTAPAHGTLSFHPDGTFVYTPVPGFAGDDSFTYAASDGTTTSAPATVTLHVVGINQAPSFTKGPDITLPAGAGPQSIANWATNISPGPNAFDIGQSVSFAVSYVAVDNPGFFSQIPSIDPTGKLTFTPAPGAAGTVTVSAELADTGGTANGGRDTSDTQFFTITVQPAPPAPVQFTGHLYDVYPQANGAGLTQIAARPVFDDANGNGVPDPGEAVAYTNNAGLYTLSLPAGAHTIRPVPKPGWTTPTGYPASVTADSSAPTGHDLYTTMADPVIIDVLAVHPDSLSTLAAVPWDTAIRNAFQVANYIFANSDTNVRLRLLDVQAVSYAPSSTSLDVDLNHLITLRDGVLDTVPKVRDSLKADLAILFDARPDAAGNYGVAKLLNPVHPDASLGYAVVVATNSADATGTVLAHEIGHTLGADHDPQNHPQTKIAWAHGYRFTASNGTVYRDVMAYAPGTQLPFFSTPHVSYAGHLLGDAATADAARVVRSDAYIVAGYRGAAVFPPFAIPATAVVTTKAPANPSATVSATVKVRNDFVSKFSGNVSVTYYLSADKTLDTSDTLLTRKTVSARNLNPKATLSTAATFKVPAGTRAGAYYVLAVATAAGQPVDPHKSLATAAAALKVAAPVKKKTKTAKVVAAGFQSAKPIAEQATERRTDDADDVITGMLASPK